MDMFEDTNDPAHGHWFEILVRLGTDRSLLDGGHHSCPFCGGTDRFRFRDHDVNYRLRGDGRCGCNQCTGDRGEDGYSFVMRDEQITYAEARKLVMTILDEIDPACAPIELPPEIEHSIEYDKKSIAAWARKRKEMWGKEKHVSRVNPKNGLIDDPGPRPINQYSPTGKYLLQRTGICPATEDLREQLMPKGCFYMLALFRGPGDAHVLHVDTTVHRTPIGPDYKVAAKRTFSEGLIPAGGAVRLLPIDDRMVLGVAEGIETGLSAARLFNIPVWAALNAGLMEKWQPPAGIKKVVIFGDYEDHGRGSRAAEKLERRLLDEGSIPVVDVQIPPVPDGEDKWDWNDEYQARQVTPHYMRLLKPEWNPLTDGRNRLGGNLFLDRETTLKYNRAQRAKFLQLKFGPGGGNG
jgi:putative DNA primase/helicase